MAHPHDRSRGDTQRWASILVGAAIIAVAGWLTIEAQSAHPITKDTAGTAPAASASAVPSATAAPADAGAASEADLDAGLFLPTLSLGDAAVMPSGAPRSVKIGVVLVSFAGAEGAPSNARSKKDAQ